MIPSVRNEALINELEGVAAARTTLEGEKAAAVAKSDEKDRQLEAICEQHTAQLLHATDREAVLESRAKDAEEKETVLRFVLFAAHCFSEAGSFQVALRGSSIGRKMASLLRNTTPCRRATRRSLRRQGLRVKRYTLLSKRWSGKGAGPRGMLIRLKRSASALTSPRSSPCHQNLLLRLDALAQPTSSLQHHVPRLSF